MPSKPLISIVDDDEAVRKATKSLIRALGFLAETFESGEEFLKFDDRHKTACLIADVRMPQMSGLDLHRHLIASGISIPSILMTAHPDDSLRALALEAGVICFLAKPFTKKHLLDCIRTALDRGLAGRR